MLKATLAQIAVQNVTVLTEQITALKGSSGEADKMASLYDFRLKEILAALRNGVTMEELEAITGNRV